MQQDMKRAVQPLERPFPFKLAAIDIDDTLLGPDKRISQDNRRAIQALHARGVRVVLASGRGYHDMLRYQRELGLEDFMVCCQGAEVRHPTTGEVLHGACLPADAAHAIIERGLALGLTVFCYTRESVAVNHDSSWARFFRDTSPTERVEVRDLRGLDMAGVLKVIWADEAPRVEALGRAEPGSGFHPDVHSLITFPCFLEFAPNQATKAVGVAAVAARYAIPREQVMAFGDGNNDVPVLAWAGLGVAMPDGQDAAKSAAKMVAPEGAPGSALARGIEQILKRY